MAKKTRRQFAPEYKEQAMPDPGERPLGNHAVTIVGWTDHASSLLFQNSYGPDWGDNGYGVLTRQYADLYMREAWTIRVGSCGPNDKNWNAVTTATGKKLARAWSSSEKAVAGLFKGAGKHFDYRFCPVVSLGRSCHVDIVEIRSTGAGDREGGLHLYHHPDASKGRSVIGELTGGTEQRTRPSIEASRRRARDCLGKRRSTARSK